MGTCSGSSSRADAGPEGLSWPPDSVPGHPLLAGWTVRPQWSSVARRITLLSTERVGFEPTRREIPPTRFPIALLKPLGHLSGEWEGYPRRAAEGAPVRPEPLAFWFTPGGVREWLNRAVSKTVVPFGVPWVRIPPPPLDLRFLKLLRDERFEQAVWSAHHESRIGVQPRIPGLLAIWARSGCVCRERCRRGP